MRRFLLPLTLSLAAPALAEDRPSFDCTTAEGDIEAMVCGDTDLAALDRRVADRFGEALAAAQALDTQTGTSKGVTAAEDMLREGERDWIAARDACAADAEPRACAQTAYLRREAELVALWTLEPARNTAFWTCDGDPDNAVVTIFFDTELPSIRFERGSSVDVGTEVRTASGARYDAASGRSIWMRGKEAAYDDPDGADYSCVLSGEG